MITVVIPSFQQAEYLPIAVDSVLHQTKTPAELIIVEDGSTDNSLAIAKRYQGSQCTKNGEYFKVKVISQVNKGLASARNTGIMNSFGDYIAFLDADDFYLENYIERVSEVIKRTKADIIAPSFRCFGLGSQDIVLMSNPTIEDFKQANRIGYCSVVKKKALLEVGGFNPKMIYGWEDYDLWFDLLKRGKKLITIPEVLWCYRTKEKSMWGDSLNHKDYLQNQLKLNHPSVFNG